MKTLELPDPAHRLWLETRDVLSALDPTARRRAYTPWLGGGTVLAARWRHRLSTDIDVVIRDTTNLEWLQRDDDRNIARRLAARVEAAASGRIKLRRGAGLIDLNAAPVSPRGDVFDNADTRPWERLDGTNPSMKRSGAPRTATVSRGDRDDPVRGRQNHPAGDHRRADAKASRKPALTTPGARDARRRCRSG